MAAYYNEFDPFAAAWLRALIADGLIAPGEVDERSIKDVRGDDLKGFTQCHFFAGIGGWSYALRLAGWPDHRPVWTGSCPCQPFSEAGPRTGIEDERHLWPDMFRLICERGPSVVFGEQISATDGLIWLTGVRTDLEGAGYAFGCADLGAASVGAPHRRQRTYWMADAQGERWRGRSRAETPAGDWAETRDAGCLVNSESEQVGQPGQPWQHWDVVDCRDGKSRRVEPGTFPLAHGVPDRVDMLRGFGNAIVPQVAAEFIQAADEAMMFL